MISIDAKPRARPDGSLDQAHFFKVLCADQRWRLNNLYWIKNEDGKRVKFRLRDAQKKLLEEMHSRNIILKARQLGFTTFIQIYILDYCIFTPNTNAGVVAHREKDAKAFFSEKIKFAYNHLPTFVKRFCPAKQNSSETLSFANGSIIMVSTSLRSGTYQIVHVSEHGKLCARFPDRAEELKTGTLNTVHANGIIFIESTAEGRHGDFFNFCQEARKLKEEHADLSTLDWKFHFYPWWKDPKYVLDVPLHLDNELIQYFSDLEAGGIYLSDAQKMWYAKKAAEQGDKMKQEFPSTPDEAFEASVHGAYFHTQMRQVRAKGQIRRVPIEPNIPIHTFWDLGRDTTAIWFFQKVGFDYRFVDYFSHANEDIDYYIEMLKSRKDGIKPYNYGVMYLPHDGSSKSLSAKYSVAETLFEHGYEVDVVQRTKSQDLAIGRARRVLPMCWFDRAKCAEGIKCLDAYRRLWDEKLETWRKQELHDWASHGAKAFMTFADGFCNSEDDRVGRAITAEELEEQERRTRRPVQKHMGRSAATGY